MTKRKKSPKKVSVYWGGTYMVHFLVNSSPLKMGFEEALYIVINKKFWK